MTNIPHNFKETFQDVIESENITGDFKKIYEDDPKESGVLPIPILPHPFALFTTPSLEILPAVKIQDIEALVNGIIFLSHEIKTLGVETTSCIVQTSLSETDFVEIILSTFDTAPGAYNIEINTCDKLGSLLHSHQGTLISQLTACDARIKVNRLEFNGRSLNLKKDKIEGSSSRKVTKAK